MIFVTYVTGEADVTGVADVIAVPGMTVTSAPLEVDSSRTRTQACSTPLVVV